MEEPILSKAAFRLLQDMVAFDQDEREAEGRSLNKATGEVLQLRDVAADGMALAALVEAGLIAQKTRYKGQTSQRYAVTLTGLEYFDDEVGIEAERIEEKKSFAKELAGKTAIGIGEGLGKAIGSSFTHPSP